MTGVCSEVAVLLVLVLCVLSLSLLRRMFHVWTVFMKCFVGSSRPVASCLFFGVCAWLVCIVLLVPLVGCDL